MLDHPTPFAYSAAPSASRPLHPTFLGIGAAKCGTTTLSQLLSQHPQVALPTNRKELHFFDEQPVVAKSLRRYLAHFDPTATATGEFTPSYLFDPKCRDLIADHLRHDLRLLVILRDPVERAWSHYWHAKKRWDQPRYRSKGYPVEELSFEGAIAAEPERLRSGRFHIRHQSYFSKGLYADQIEYYLQRFDRRQIHILLLEDLIRDPAAKIRHICAFLGIDEGFTVTDVPRLNQQSDGTCPQETRAWLVERYRPSIERLEALLDRDLSHWKR